MSVHELRAEILGLLAEIRSEGRGASRHRQREVFERRLPALIFAEDRHRGAEVAAPFRDRLRAAVSEACGRVKAGALPTTPNGQLHDSTSPSGRGRVLAPRPRWAWGVGLAAAAAVIVMALLIYSVFGRKERLAPGPRPGITYPQSPVPKIEPHKPDGQIVEHGPKKKRSEASPNPRRQEGDRVATNRQPKVGEFGEISDNVTVQSSEHGEKIVAKKAAVLIEGSIIDTGDFGEAEVKLTEGSSLRLGYNTVLTVSNRKFVMKSGSVLAQVAHTSDHRKFAIETPAATAEALGTEFILAIERVDRGSAPRLKTVLQVSRGRVRFYNVVNSVTNSVVAGAMTESTAIEGESPTDPKRIFRLKDHLFDLKSGETHLTEVTSKLDANEARPRLVFSRKGAPPVPSELADMLDGATKPALSGDVEGSIRALSDLNARVAHPAVLNNLGIAYEMMDQMGPAIRCYQAAVRLDPVRALYHYNLGVALQRIGNTPRSIDELKAAVKIAPGYIAAVFELAHDYDLLERSEDALAVIEACLKLHPNAARLWQAKGTVFFDSKQWDEAEQAYLRVIEITPKDTNTWHQLGYLYRFWEKPQKSEEAFRRAVEIDPRDPVPLKELASAYQIEQLPDKAEETFLKVLDLAPDWGAAHDAYGWLLENSERYDKAESEYRRAIALAPLSSEYHNNLAALLSTSFKGREREAETEYREAMRLDPAHVHPCRGLAQLLADEGRNAEAESLFKHAIELDPGDPSSYGALGSFYRERGRFRESVLTIRLGVKSNPEAANLYSRLGQAEADVHEWAESIKALRKSLKLEPSEPQTLFDAFYLAFSLVHTGGLVEAEEVSAKALARNPEDLGSQSIRAYVLAHLRTRLDEALALAQNCARSPGADAFDWEVLGLVRLRRGELDLAIGPLKRAAADFGRSLHAAEAIVFLGEGYEARGDVIAATDAYRRALAIEPSNNPAKEALRRLGK